MTRNGKIARLPRQLRDELNRRIDDGEQGADLVQWLNALDDVKKILADGFEGRPISEQNLSEWKQGGFREWQRRQEIRNRVGDLLERSDDLDAAGGDRSIPEHLARVLAAELAAEAQTLLEKTGDPAQRWQYLRQALRQLHLLRKADHRAARARMEIARWEIECEQRELQKEKDALAEAKQRAMAPLREHMRRPALVMACGGGAAGEEAADLILETERKYSLPKPSRSPSRKPKPPPANQT